MMEPLCLIEPKKETVTVKIKDSVAKSDMFAGEWQYCYMGQHMSLIFGLQQQLCMPTKHMEMIE